MKNRKELENKAAKELQLGVPTAVEEGVLGCVSTTQLQGVVYSGSLNRSKDKERKVRWSMAEQTERAYQKQPTVFLNDKWHTQGIGKKPKKRERYVKNIGLGFKTPREAIEGTYIDKKCPWTGNVSIRGRILSGVVVKCKMQRTIVIRRDYLHFVPKYRRYEKRHKNMSVHCSPCFRDVAPGDVVTIGECRPLCKTVRFNVLKVVKATSSKKGFEKF